MASASPKGSKHCTWTAAVKHFLQAFPEPSQLCQQVGNFFFFYINIVSKRKHSQGV